MSTRSSEKTGMSKEPTQLALVPLHPGCPNKKKLEAKDFPLVVGRTNLASWWWKSCPCEKYCRLHCKPVAQNIRSLSKVMIMIDSFGCLNVVGKNPHLITVTPERSDHMLQENDILSIGRRDREPWMRLQVVKKPADTQLLSRQKPKTDEEWMANQRNKDGTSTTAKNDQSASSPPKWITTTRKRNSSSRVSSSKQQRTTSDRIGAATHEPVANNMHPNLPDGLDSDLHKRKRRRTRESLRDQNQRRSLEDNNGPVFGNNEKQYPIGATKAADHSHLVVQDYETSAMLVQATQRKRRQNSNNGSCAGRMGAHRSLTTGKSQLKLLYRSFAAPLTGASPASESKTLPNHNYDATAHQGDDEIHQDSQHSKLKMESSLSGPVEENVLVAIEPTVEDRRLDDLQPEGLNNACAPVAEQTNKEVLQDHPTDKNCTLLEPATFEKTEEVERILPHKPDSVDKRAENIKPEASLRNDTTSVSQEASMLSLPLCVSSTAETHKQECPSLSNSANAKTQPFKECSISPTLQDPATSLGPWRAIVQQEQGNQSSFRYALASLIVAKNEEKAADEDSSMWLPDLLEDGLSK